MSRPLASDVSAEYIAKYEAERERSRKEDAPREAHAWLCHPVPEIEVTHTDKDGRVLSEYRVQCVECDWSMVCSTNMTRDQHLSNEPAFVDLRKNIKVLLEGSFTPTHLDRLRRFGNKKLGITPEMVR